MCLRKRDGLLRVCGVRKSRNIITFAHSRLEMVRRLFWVPLFCFISAFWNGKLFLWLPCASSQLHILLVTVKMNNDLSPAQRFKRLPRPCPDDSNPCSHLNVSGVNPIYPGGARREKNDSLPFWAIIYRGSWNFFCLVKILMAGWNGVKNH